MLQSILVNFYLSKVGFKDSWPLSMLGSKVSKAVRLLCDFLKYMQNWPYIGKELELIMENILCS